MRRGPAESDAVVFVALLLLARSTIMPRQARRSSQQPEPEWLGAFVRILHILHMSILHAIGMSLSLDTFALEKKQNKMKNQTSN